MKAATKEKVSTVSDERKEELRDEWEDLAAQEQQEMDTLAEASRSMVEAQVNLIRIQVEKGLVIQELMEGESAPPQALELTPNMADEAMNALKAEFAKGTNNAKKAGYVVQEGMDFAALEAKLRADENKDKLASLYRMVQAGSCPAVVCQENGRFCIAETFGQTLPKRANCVYNRKAQKQVGRENCNGNAVHQARAMGIPLMERRIASAHLAAFPDRNQYCYDYIQATEGERESGSAPCVVRDGGGAGVPLRCARGHYGNRGWRGALWV